MIPMNVLKPIICQCPRANRTRRASATTKAKLCTVSSMGLTKAAIMETVVPWTRSIRTKRTRQQKSWSDRTRASSRDYRNEFRKKCRADVRPSYHASHRLPTSPDSSRQQQPHESFTSGQDPRTVDGYTHQYFATNDSTESLCRNAERFGEHGSISCQRTTSPSETISGS